MIGSRSPKPCMAACARSLASLHLAYQLVLSHIHIQLAQPRHTALSSALSASPSRESINMGLGVLQDRKLEHVPGMRSRTPQHRRTTATTLTH